MKFLIVGDTHFRTIRPRYRMDPDYFQTQLNKLNEIFDIAVNEQVDGGIVHTGDFFDRFDTELRILNAIVAILRQGVKKKKIKFYCVLGNHDIQGYCYDSIFKTGLCNLIKSGLVKLIVEPTKLGNLTFTGVHFKNKISPEDYNLEADVIVTHNMLVPEPVVFEHVLLSDVAKVTKAKFIFCGHYHFPFDVTIDNTRFINPGSLMRLTIGDVKRSPSVLLFDEQNIKQIPLKSALPGPQVFDTLAVSEKKQQNLVFGEFLEQLSSVKLHSFKLSELVKQIAKVQNIEKEVVDEALRRLGEVKST
jgi:DNA repair exonuclease SbcCD nuclease subunit